MKANYIYLKMKNFYEISRVKDVKFSNLKTHSIDYSVTSSPITFQLINYIIKYYFNYFFPKKYNKFKKI